MTVDESSWRAPLQAAPAQPQPARHRTASTRRTSHPRPRAFILASVMCCVAASVLAAPSSPTNLQAVVAGDTVSFTWTPSPGATGYRLEAGSAPGLSDLALSTIPASPTYSVGSVPAGVYYVRLRALDASGASAPSNEVIVTVGGAMASCSTAPDPPIQLRASVEGPQVALSWAPASTGCAATAFIVRAGSSQGAADLAQIAVQSTGFSTTAPDGLYFVSVVAVNAFGASAPSGEIVLPVAVPTAAGRVGFNTATPAIGADAQGNAVIIGEVVNRSLAHAVFIEITAVVKDPGNRSIGTVSTFLRGQPRRLAASGTIDDSALAPGEIGCFYLPTSLPVSSVGAATLQLDHESFASTAMRNKVTLVDVRRLSGGATVTMSGAVMNTGTQPTFFNMANFYTKRADGRAVGCDFAFVPNSEAALPPAQPVAFTAATRAPASASSVTAWMQWQEAGDPLAGLAIDTYRLMLQSLASDEAKRQSLAAWNALQQQRRSLARQFGR